MAIDDHSRAGFMQMHSDERKGSAVEFLKAAVAHYAALGIKHTFTRPYRPHTNGKAERFIQTCLREWAYGRVWASSDERTAWLPVFFAYYNARRPHSAMGYKPPASRLAGNNHCNSTIRTPRASFHRPKADAPIPGHQDRDKATKNRAGRGFLSCKNSKCWRWNTDGLLGVNQFHVIKPSHFIGLHEVLPIIFKLLLKRFWISKNGLTICRDGLKLGIEAFTHFFIGKRFATQSFDEFIDLE